MSGFLRRAFEHRERLISGQTTDEAFRHDLQPSYTGRYVTPDTSLQIATVTRCVHVLADNIAQLPLKVYRRDSQGNKDEATSHPLSRLLHRRPNALMTPYTWKQVLFASVLLRGNAYQEIMWGGDGWPAELWPLLPGAMNARLEGRKPVYEYSSGIEDGGRAGRINPGRIHHLRGLSHDGFVGHSVVRQAMQTMGLALATEEFGARFFGHGATPGLVLQHPNTLTPEAAGRIRASWEAQHKGLEGSHRPAVLEEGMTVERIGIPPEEAQFLQTRRYQAIEICRWFGVPPHMVFDLERATFSNIEHQSIAFVQDSLMPWIVNHEEQLRIDLIEREGWESDIWAEYQVEGRLRGDTLSRYRTYQIGVMYGLASRNEVRAKENLPAYTGGDEMLMPANLTPVSRAEGREGDEPEPGAGLADRSLERRQEDVQHLRDLWAEAQGKLEARLADVVAMETAAVREQLEAAATLQLFVEWLYVYYGEQLPAAYVEALISIVRPMAVSTARLVTLGLGESWTAALRDEIEAFAEEALATDAAGYAGSHRRQVEALIGDEGAAGGEAAAAAAVEERLVGWSETEAGKRARHAAFELGNAAAMAAMAGLGVALVMWAARGDACQYCRALDGEVVAVGESFVPAGGTVTGEDGEALTVNNKRGHPPLHGGCDCGVRAVQE